MECGSNYARSMASFALLPIFSGMKFDLPHGELGFDPIGEKDGFNSLFSVGTGWGNVEIGKNSTKINIKGGSLSLSMLDLPYIKTPRELFVDGVKTEFAYDGKLRFEKLTAAKCIEVIM